MPKAYYYHMITVSQQSDLRTEDFSEVVEAKLINKDAKKVVNWYNII